MICVKCGQELMQGAAFCPYCGEKADQRRLDREEPVYQAEVKGLLRSGKLVVYRDRTEFVTSSVQKSIFNYTGLVSIKKGWDSIDFVTEDGRTESCPASRKNVHEAFLYIEQAAKPYLAERNNRLLSQGVRYSFPSSQGLLNDGVLELSADQAVFKAKSGKSEIVSFQDVKAVKLSAGTLDFILFDRSVKSFAVSKDLREEVFAFAADSVAPYLARRNEELLARGIYFSFLSPEGGTLDVLADRVEYTSRSGQTEAVAFSDVRIASIYDGRLELALTDGTSKSWWVDEDARNEVLPFVKQAIEPYVTARTAGFDAAFGSYERIEVNGERGVFHIIRQGGREISEEWPVAALTRCEWIERKELTALGSMVSGSIALFKSAAKAAGSQGAAEAEEWVSRAGVALTVCTGQDQQVQNVWFGDFPAGISRMNQKYDRYLAEGTEFMDYLKDLCPECELVLPVAPERTDGPEPDAEHDPPEDTRTVDEPDRPEEETAGDSGAERDELGLTRYLEGVSRFIGSCATPMTIAIQGNRGSGENSILGMLYNRLKERYGDRLLWLSARSFSQSESGEALSILVGRRLVDLLSGENHNEGKDRAVKIATNLAGFVTGMIASDASVGQNMAEGLFNRGSSDSPEQMVRLFSRQIAARTQGEHEKVVLVIDGLDRLAPARAVELLEAMRDYFDCAGCVFVLAADYAAVLSGARERYGQDFDEEKGKRFFDELFKMPFRVPTSSYNVGNYVKSKLERMGISAGDEAELDLYVALIQNSVGKEDLESIDRLFDAFLLLQNMADEELYESRYQRLALFALLCMQTKFRNVYDCVVKEKDNMTPGFLAGLCGRSPEFWDRVQIGDGEKAAFQEFGGVFARVVNLDEEAEISPAECRAFAEALEFSGITSK